jgi:NADP-dependent 3-hydroxy acid dehydrogenase YdfG
MNKSIMCTGNPEYGLAQGIAERWPETEFVGRSTWGYDLTDASYQDKLAEKALKYDVFINCSALWKFNQCLVLDVVYKAALKNGKRLHIVNIGSTTDRTSKGTDWLYHFEKKALRDMSNSLGLKGVWATGPKVSYISVGTLGNNAHKHPGRKTLAISEAVDYIEFVLNAPDHLTINEISIDALQMPPKQD